MHEDGPGPRTHDEAADGRITLNVPAREVSLSGGEPAIRRDDTSGPLGHDVPPGSDGHLWISSDHFDNVDDPGRFGTPINIITPPRTAQIGVRLQF